MRYLFIHQNFPGQFRHVVPALLADPENEIIAIGERSNVRPDDTHARLKIIAYPSPSAGDAKAVHPYLRDVNAATLRGQAVARILLTIKNQGFTPDLIVVHPAWGEALFIKDVFADSPILGYLEFFYRAHGSDVNFDPEYQDNLDSQLRLRMRNSVHLLALDALTGKDSGVSPTEWQKAQFPEVYRPRITVLHEGINTKAIVPDSNAEVSISGVRIRAGDEALTYVARGLEPYRGFHSFMRSLPEILSKRPLARVIIVGSDTVSYGRRLPAGETYRKKLHAELADRIDWSRVHFVGKLAYPSYLKVLQLSRAHVYLTYPFVLSWSMLEAMAAGCVVIGSDTPPVREVIEDQRNGFLVDFFDTAQIARTVVDVLGEPERYVSLRAEARKKIVENYDLQAICLPRMLNLVQQLASGDELTASGR